VSEGNQPDMPDVMFKPKKPNSILILGPRWSQVIWQSTSLLLIALLIGLGVNSLRPGRLPLVADWSMKAQVSSGPGKGSLLITLEEAEILYFDQQAVFLDARSEEVFRMGHIEGAKNLPWEDFDKYYPEVMSDIPREAVIVTYCDGETCGLSKELAFTLVAKGYDHVRVLLDGWRQWQEFNLPIEP
jgi:rhodanese-related sulfurtransferase